MTYTNSSEYLPAWSPDGNKIAFTSDRDGNGEIYVMNIDGSAPVNLTHTAAWDGYAAYSPDGSKIAYWSGSNLHVMNADGSEQTDLGVEGQKPAWSPDGNQIAFHRWVSGDREIFVMDADGSNVTQLTGDHYGNAHPRWAPDSETIVFASLLNAGQWNIHTVKADGSDMKRVIESPTLDWEPDWLIRR